MEKLTITLNYSLTSTVALFYLLTLFKFFCGIFHTFDYNLKMGKNLTYPLNFKLLSLDGQFFVKNTFWMDSREITSSVIDSAAVPKIPSQIYTGHEIACIEVLIFFRYDHWKSFSSPLHSTNYFFS